MRSPQTVCTVSALVLSSLFAAAAVAGIGAAAGGGGKPCSSNFPIPEVSIAYYDTDLDGFDDQWQINADFPPSFFQEAWFNVTVLWPNGSVAAQYNNNHYASDTTYTYDGFTFTLFNTTDPNGTYGAFVYFDYTDGACEYWYYDHDFRPPGDYHPAVEGTALIRTADQNTSVQYTLAVRNDGNNPDTFTFYAQGNESWPLWLSIPDATLEPRENATLTVTVAIPENTSAGTIDLINLSATSQRNSLRITYLEMRATVSAQIFGMNLKVAESEVMGENNDVVSFHLTLRNLGNNRDTFSLSFPAAPSGWQVLPSTMSLTLAGGQPWTFTVEVRLPGSVTWEPRLNATVTLRSMDGQTNASVVLHARLHIPDFVIGVAGIVVNNSAPLEGAQVSVQVNVVNVGAPVAVTFAVSLSDGRANYTAIIDMTVAGSTVASFSWTALAGATTFNAFADSTNSVPEENENNNHGNLSISTPPPPPPANLKPLAAGNASTGAHAGEAVTISAVGSSDPDGSIAGYYFVFGDGADSGWVTTQTVTHSYASAGSYTATIRVRDNDGTESDPVTQTIGVAPASTTGGNGGGNGTGDQCGTSLQCPAPSSPVVPIVLLLLVAAAVGGLLMLRTRKKPGPPSAAPAPSPTPETPAAAPPESPKAP